MGNIVIKPEQDRDEYVYWSTETEAPVGYGGRAQMLKIMAGDTSYDYHGTDAGNPPAVRLERADSEGSSAMDGYTFGHWQYGEFIYQQRGMLLRRDLYRAAQLLAEGRDAEVWNLLAPLDGETKARRG